MNEKTDLQLINEIKITKSDDAYNELLVRHTGLFQKIYQKYEGALSNSGFNNKEVLDNKDHVFVKAIYSFDDSKKNKFSSWLGNQVRFFCLDLINDNINLFHPVTEEENRMVEEQMSFDSRLLNSDNLDYFNFMLSQLSDQRVADVIRYRFLDTDRNHRKWNYIAKQMGISVMTASKLCQKGLQLMKYKLTSKQIQDSI